MRACGVGSVVLIALAMGCLVCDWGVGWGGIGVEILFFRFV